MMLFCVLMLTAMPLATVLAQDEEEYENLDEQQQYHQEEEQQEQHYEQEQQHYHEEEEQQQEPEQQYQEVVQERVEEIQEQAQEYVEEMVEQAKEEMEYAEEHVEKVVASTKEVSGGLVDKVVSEAKSLVNRIKSMNKADAKKVAAAALGVWGVSVGVGWLAQTVKAGAADGGGASVGGPAKKASFGMKK
jgi:DNA anti-recombination protein RmuC